MFSFIQGAHHGEGVFQSADGGFDTGAPVQGALEPALLLVFGAFTRQASARRQGHVLDPEFLRLALVVGGKETTVAGGHIRYPPKTLLMVFKRWGKRVGIGGVALEHLVSADDAILRFVQSHQSAKLVRLMGFAFANDLAVRLE